MHREVVTFNFASWNVQKFMFLILQKELSKSGIISIRAIAIRVIHVKCRSFVKLINFVIFNTRDRRMRPRHAALLFMILIIQR